MKTNKKSEETIVDKKKQKNPIVYALTVVILVVVVVTFVGSPVAVNIGGGERVVFGRWANKPIVFFPDLSNYFAEQVEIIERNSTVDRSSPNFDQLRHSLRVWREAFERTVIHTAILWKLERSSVTVSNSRIDRMLVNHGPYLVNGEFNIDRYNNTPISERNRHRVHIRDSLLRQQYIDDIIFGIKTSQHELDFISTMGKNEITLDIAYISFNEFPENEVISFAEENIDLFRSIELSRITILSSRRDAQRIHSIVAGNPDAFRDTAINHSADRFAGIGGDMGRVYNHDLRMELRNRADVETVLALRRGEVSPLLEIHNGWVIYRCNNNPQDFDLSDPDSINIVRNYMTIYELGIIENYFLQRAMEVKSATDFRSAAARNNFTIYRTSSFPINFRNHELFRRAEIENAPMDLRMINFNQDLLERAFSLRENEISEPITLGNSVVLLSLVERSENEDFSNFLNSVWPFLLQQAAGQSVSSFILESDRLRDNFEAVFTQHFF
ncbi:MAG: peptidylprolyl isomerase [Spirochaetaceae bacterium]|nr:peptidylprolyl isomerase [Spirochaetaceae bacterium]